MDARKIGANQGIANLNGSSDDCPRESRSA